MIQSMDELRQEIRDKIYGLPLPKDQTGYAKGKHQAYTEILELISPEKRTPTHVVFDTLLEHGVVLDNAQRSALAIVRRLAKEGFVSEGTRF